MALNKRNAETARSYDPADYAVEDATTNADENRIFGVRLGDLLAGISFEGVTFDAFEVYAHWSDASNGIVVTVNARRKLTPAEMGRLAHLCNTATPGRPAVDVYAEWAATLETPIDYHGEAVVPADNIFADLLPINPIR